MTKRCICEICTCGRHRCPHRPRGPINKGDSPCLLSEYANTYIKKYVPMRDSFKPKFQAIRGQGPMSDQTTFRTDYVARQLDRPFVRQPEPYQPPEGNIDTMTSYKQEYTDKKVQPAKAIRREEARKIDAKFEGEPTYKHDYRKWSIAPREKADMEPHWQPPTDKFEGNTTFHHDYIRHNQPPRKSLKPDERAMMSDVPLDDKTGYRETYIKHPIPSKFKHEKDAWAPPSVPMDGLTTQRHDFNEKRAEKPENFSPSKVPYMSNQPFDGHTTFRNDFKAWQLDKPFVHAPEPYTKPEGLMDLRSTTHIDFPLRRGEPAMAKKPSVRRPNSAAFEGTTNYSQDFRRWGLTDRAKPSMKEEYSPPSAPFEGISTFTSHYIPHRIVPTQNFKPDSTAFISDTKFADETMYRMEFVPKKSDMCPAAILDTRQSQYIYKDQDDVGHKFYQNVVETVTKLPGRETGDAAINKMAALAVA